MRDAVDAAGGDSAALAVLAPCSLKSLDRVRQLVDAGVTDVLVQARAPDSYASALDAYSEIVTAFAGAGSR